MFYGSTLKATNFTKKELNHWKIKLMYFVLFFIPRANPDNEKMYHLVRKWLVEIDDDGVAVREIALDENNKALFSSPNERNYGFWTDSGEMDLSQFEPVDREYFERLWGVVNLKKN